MISESKGKSKEIIKLLQNKFKMAVYGKNVKTQMFLLSHCDQTNFTLALQNFLLVLRSLILSFFKWCVSDMFEVLIDFDILKHHKQFFSFMQSGMHNLCHYVHKS